MSFDAFRDELLAIARRRFPELPLTKSNDAEILTSGDRRFYLGNLYAIVREMPPARRETEIVHWFETYREDTARREDAIEAAADDWSKAKPLLRPKLMPTGYLPTSSNRLVHRPFSKRLLIGYALDLGTRAAYVLDTKLARWGVTPDAVHAAAIANLEAASTDIALDPIEGYGGVRGYVAIQKGDSYDADRLVLPMFRARLLAALGGGGFAGVPNRDFLVAWSKGFPSQRGFIAKIHADSTSQPYALTDEIFALAADDVHVASEEELE